MKKSSNRRFLCAIRKSPRTFGVKFKRDKFAPREGKGGPLRMQCGMTKNVWAERSVNLLVKGVLLQFPSKKRRGGKESRERWGKKKNSASTLTNGDPRVWLIDRASKEKEGGGGAAPLAFFQGKGKTLWTKGTLLDRHRSRGVCLEDLPGEVVVHIQKKVTTKRQRHFREKTP